MSPRTGRPRLGETAKDNRIGFRVSEETIQKFDACSKLSGKSKIELFETMVNDLYQKLTAKK